jgi:PAS domain S-box-containing protein
LQRKSNFARFRSHSFLITLGIIAFLVLFIAILSAVSYIDTKNNLEFSWEMSKNNLEHHLSDSLVLVSNGLRLFERTYDESLKEAFIPFIEAYNLSGGRPETIDLQKIKAGLSPALADRIDLYIINDDGIVINTTYPADMGLDFKKWPEVFPEITKIREGDHFQSDRAVIGFNSEKNVRKFAYLPTPDHKHLLELSIIIDDFRQERASFSYLHITEEIQKKNPSISKIVLYNSLLKPIKNTGVQAIDTSKEVIRNVRNAFDSKGTIEIDDPAFPLQYRYIYIPSASQGTVSDTMMDMVAKIEYDTSVFEYAKNKTLNFHLLIAIVSAILGILLASLLSIYFTRPITRIVGDIDTIARGNLDHPIHHTGSPEFIRLEGSINILVNNLKDLINTLQEKETNLSASEQRYRSLIENQSDIIIRFDNEGHILYVNKKFCSFFEIAFVAGDCQYNLITKRLKQEITGFIEQMARDNPNTIIEHRIVLESGEERCVQWSTIAIVDNSNKIIEYQGVGRDITAKKKIETALRESEVKYRTLITNLPDLIIVHKKGVIIFVNEHIIQSLGYSYNEMTGSTIFQYIPDSQHNIIADTLQLRLSGENIEPYEINLIPKQGEPLTVIVRASVIPYEGEPAVLTVLTDITTQHRAEQEIKKGEERYRKLIEQINEGIIIINSEAITTFTNPRMQEMLHYTAYEMTGRKIQSFIVPDDINIIEEQIKNRMQGISERYRLTFFTKEGVRVYTEVSATPSYSDEGKIIGSFCVVSDITIRKEAEEQVQKYTQDLEQKTHELENMRDQLSSMNQNLDRIVKERTEQVMKLLKQKDEFVMQLGHDLRTPLTPIIGLLPDLIKEEQEEMNRHALLVIDQNIRCIHEIAYKSLKLAKMDSFDIYPDIELVNIRGKIEKIIYNHEESLISAGIIIKNEIPSGLVVGADSILFCELIENIISNGIKYIQRPDGKMFITAEESGHNIIIKISDNGIGLRADEVEKVFDVFYKSDRSRHDKSSTGLGLSICRKIVENHSGTIRAESQGPGEGTTFIITLPKWNDYREE